MLGPIDVTLLDDDNIRPFPTLYLGVAPEDFIHLEEEDEESVTFSFHWIEGDITSAQGEETGVVCASARACLRVARRSP